MGDSQGSERVALSAPVRRALRDLRPVPKPDKDAWVASRAAFLSHARETQFRAATPAVEAVSWSGRFAGARISLRRFLLRDASPIAVALKAVVAVALLMAGSAGTVSAARSSLPGSALYGLKLRLETWELGQADTAGEVAATALAQTDVRVAEATRLQDRGRPVPDETADRYGEQLQLALQAAGDVEEAKQQGAQTQIADSISRQLRLMERTAAQVGNEADGAADPGVQAMIQTMREAQARFGPNEGPGSGEPATGSPGHGPQPSGTGEANEPAAADDVVAPESRPGNYGPDGFGPAWLYLPELELGGDDNRDNGAPGPGPGPGSGSEDAPGSDGTNDAPGPGPGKRGNGGSGPRSQADSGRS